MVMSLYFAVCAVFLLSGSVNSSQNCYNIKRRRNSRPIVDGHVTSMENMPYMVSLHDSGDYFCGGSILNDRYVLTSAGCVYGKEAESLTIRTGSTYVNQSGTVYAVKYTVVHPNFSVEHIDYNVALVATRDSIIFGPTVKPISLGEREPKLGEFLTVAGWGELEEGGDFQFELHFTKVQMANKTKCAIIYESALDFTDRMFCTYTEDKGTCHGDNGGPAVYNNQIVGVISHRLGCAFPKIPDVYANTAHPSIHKFIMKGIHGK